MPLYAPSQSSRSGAFGGLYDDDPELLKELERIRALRDPEGAKRNQMLGLVGALSTDEGLQRIGQQLYGSGARQQEAAESAIDKARESIVSRRAREAELARDEAFRRAQLEQTGKYQEGQLALQRAQEARQRAQDERDEYVLVADPVRGGFVRYSKRTGQFSPVEGPGGAGPPVDTSGLPPSGLPTTPAGVGKPPTESEAKSGTRAGVALSALETIAGSDPRHMKPGAIETAANVLGLPSAAQTFIAGATAGPERNVVRGAQDAFIDASLTEMTGAAYTEHQIAAFRNRFMPNYFDTPETQAIKSQAALDFVRQQAQAAGRAWTPERDMQFRRMMHVAAQSPQAGADAAPQGAAYGTLGARPAGSPAAARPGTPRPGDKYLQRHTGGG